MRPKISVIVPIYNQEKYIRECVDSIIHQDYENLEIILVDDGSTDESGKICDAYADANKQIVVMHTENNGLIRARYNGVCMASGQYVTFVDADDWIRASTYSKMIWDNENADIIVCGIIRAYADKEIVQYPYLKAGKYEKEQIEKEVLPKMLWCSDTDNWALDPSLCTKLFKRELILRELDKVKDLGCYYGEDTAVIYPLLTQINSMRILDECLYYHRQRDVYDVAGYIKAEQFFDCTFRLYEYLKKQFQESVYWEQLYPQLEHFYIKSVRMKEKCYIDVSGGLYPVFPFDKVCCDSRVIIYGAGVVGQAYVEQNRKFGYCDIVGWVDRDYTKRTQELQEVINPVELLINSNYDYVIIAIDRKNIAANIKRNLLDMGVPMEKIIWHSVNEIVFQ